MSLFLFAKQFVDMFYNLRVLDYIMVAFALVLVAYQFALVRPNVKKSLTVSDGIVLGIVLLITATFIRSGNGYQTYFKLLSAFLLYVVGRIYYDRILECETALAIASYFIVYINLFDRIVRFGTNIFTIKNTNGDLYYYDTDMAFAMILAMVFIAMFAKTGLLKIITIILVCPYMVFWSDAGIQQVLMIAVYLILLVYISEIAFRKRKLSGMIVSLLLTILVAFIVIIQLPLIGIGTENLLRKILPNNVLNVSNMNSHLQNLQIVVNKFSNASIWSKLFGVDMLIDMPMGNMYVKTLYISGWIGIVLVLAFIISIMYYVYRVNDRKTFFLCVIMAIMLLGSGVTINGMESTQMSWFPMMFAGMVVSSVNVNQFWGREFR